MLRFRGLNNFELFEFTRNYHSHIYARVPLFMIEAKWHNAFGVKYPSGNEYHDLHLAGYDSPVRSLGFDLKILRYLEITIIRRCQTMWARNIWLRDGDYEILENRLIANHSGIMDL